jgi:hypothetical protein
MNRELAMEKKRRTTRRAFSRPRVVLPQPFRGAIRRAGVSRRLATITPIRSLFQTPFDFTPFRAFRSMGPSSARGKRLAFPSKRARLDVAFARNERFEASFSRNSIPQDRESSFKRV